MVTCSSRGTWSDPESTPDPEFNCVLYLIKGSTLADAINWTRSARFLKYASQATVRGVIICQQGDRVRHEVQLGNPYGCCPSLNCGFVGTTEAAWSVVSENDVCGFLDCYFPARLLWRVHAVYD